MINVDDRLVKEELPKIGVDAFAVLMVITSHINNARRAWPGIERIRELTKLSKERAYNAVKTLIEAGHIERTQENIHGEWGKVVYRVTSTYLGVYVPASHIELSSNEPLAAFPEYGNPESGKPEDAKAAHRSIKQKGSIKQKEVLEQTVGASEAEAPAPDLPDYEKTYQHLTDYLEQNKHLVSGIQSTSGFSGAINDVLKDYLIDLQEKGEWFKLKPPTSDGEHFRWVASILAGVTKWAKYRKNNPKRQSNRSGPAPRDQSEAEAVRIQLTPQAKAVLALRDKLQTNG